MAASIDPESLDFSSLKDPATTRRRAVRARRPRGSGAPIVEVGVAIGVVGLALALLGLLVSALITGKLELDASGLVGFFIGVGILIALVGGAVRLVVLSLTTRHRVSRE